MCTGGELTVALRAGVDPRRIGLHGNNKSDAEIELALDAGVGRIIADSFDEIDRLVRLVTARGRGERPRIMVRVTTGVEAHTHEYIATAHEDQKFGFSIASGQALEALRAVHAAPELDLAGIHSHIGSQIFDAEGFAVAARRTLRTARRVRRGDRGRAAGDGPRRRLRHRLHQHRHAGHAGAPGRGHAADRGDRVRRARASPYPHLSIEPGRAISGPSAFALYTVGTVKQVHLDGDAVRTYVAVDGGMSDNIRTALYAAEYSATLASRRSAAGPAISRVVGKHCEGGDILVRDEFLPADIAPGDLLAVPASGAYSRSMASNYNHVPRPPVIAVRDGRIQALLRRETLDDILRLDVG